MSKHKDDNLSAGQDPTAPEPAEQAEVEEKDPIQVLTEERDQLRDQLMRMAAETENYKKRTERDKAEFLKRANESLIKDLLPVLDNLERALEHQPLSDEARGILEGLFLIKDELWKVLERHGVERVEALGQPFDPEVHEAMMQQEDPEAEDGTVINQLQQGYLHQGRLLRPAMVVVSKAPAPSPEDADEDEVGQSIKVTVH